MRFFIIVGLAAVMMLGCDHVGSLDEDVGPNTDSDSDADTDTGTDTDSDTDADTDTDADIDADTDSDTDTDTGECVAPAGITDWGGPCHTTADCPPNTSCIMLGGMDETQGFCTVECCNFATEDPAYCTNVAVGQEGCLIGFSPDGVNFEPPFSCLITCNAPADCPTGTDCVDAGGQLICYGYAPAK